MALPNARIDQLPANGTFTGLDKIPIWNEATLQTEYVTIESLVGTSTDEQNFEWVSGHAYLADEVVTRGGNWYQALVDNTDVTPGSDPATWELITKSGSSGLTIWQSGVYTQAETYVVSNHKGTYDIYRLFTGARPYNSTNIATEETVGIWIPIINPLRKQDVSFSGGTALDFKGGQDIVFHNISGGNQVWSIVHGASALRFKAIMPYVGAGDVHTFPTNWKMSDVRKSGNDWTALSDGFYVMEGSYDPTTDVWIIKINDEPYT